MTASTPNNSVLCVPVCLSQYQVDNGATCMVPHLIGVLTSKMIVLLFY